MLMQQLERVSTETDEHLERSTRAMIGTALIILPGILLVVSAALKFIGVPPVVQQMAGAGFAGGKLTLLATLEIISAVLFLWPRSRSIGLLLVSAYLGGAICSHVQTSEYARVIPSTALLSLAWIGMLLRHPRLFWSLK